MSRSRFSFRPPARSPSGSCFWTLPNSPPKTGSLPVGRNTICAKALSPFCGCFSRLRKKRTRERRKKRRSEGRDQAQPWCACSRNSSLVQPVDSTQDNINGRMDGPEERPGEHPGWNDTPVLGQAQKHGADSDGCPNQRAKADPECELELGGRSPI